MTGTARVGNRADKPNHISCPSSPGSQAARFSDLARQTGVVAVSPSRVGDDAFLLHGGRGFGLPLKIFARRHEPGSQTTRNRTDAFHVRKHGAFDEPKAEKPESKSETGYARCH